MPHQNQRVLGVIPARLGSTRLPRKVLREIAGQPMLSWVYHAARACTLLDQVLIATDSEEVLSYAQQHGLPTVFTPADCASGSDRVHAVGESIPADIYVNIQGDEPLLRPEHLDALLAPMSDPAVQVTTLATDCTPANIANPNAVKVVTSASGRALYFSRAGIPYDRDQAGSVPYRKHLGIYAYRKEALKRFPTLPPSRLEAIEKLEQLRFLENDIDIYVSYTPYDTIGVDTEEDLHAVEALLLTRPRP
ncbi:3-deoxy-manno-octulosonate cytidylyltransferase [Silvibacterium dinghuense]|uniref:3-deoxy-manno-octulosonate cytidylyltransferase n=1 Tax=Silvibacterium dinghuense TaxID=1560006 RepID=A0A4V1NVH4_9BACT|nr:3-deoxy-manno-octulosonate cytidylyltransferase [Silvibacterium dinghuense]RXS95780.1 3-deoxy-manno-octulosonate cytidylyltransferase [Silvibacterium dinghuense]